MTNQVLDTIGLIRAYMELINLDKTKPITDDDLSWFNCKWNASLISEYSHREMAEMLGNGISPMQNIASLKKTIELQFEQQTTPNERALADYCIRLHIAEFVGNYAVLKQLKEERYQLLNIS